MILIHRLVHQHVYGAVIRGYNRVQATVVVDVADGHASAYPRLLEPRSRERRDVFKILAGVVRKQHRFAIAEVRRG